MKNFETSSENISNTQGKESSTLQEPIEIELYGEKPSPEEFLDKLKTNQPNAYNTMINRMEKEGRDMITLGEKIQPLRKFRTGKDEIADFIENDYAGIHSSGEIIIYKEHGDQYASNKDLEFAGYGINIGLKDDNDYDYKSDEQRAEREKTVKLFKEFYKPLDPSKFADPKKAKKMIDAADKDAAEIKAKSDAEKAELRAKLKNDEHSLYEEISEDIQNIV